jgi:hypothetical protein
MGAGRMVLTAGLAAIVVACDSPSAPAGERYTLISLNAVPLPAPHPEASVLMVTSGELVLQRNNVVEETIVVACRTDLPAGTTCEVQDGGRTTRRGTYSREEEWISFGGQRSEARFDNGSILVDYAPPLSGGVFTPRLLHRYIR